MKIERMFSNVEKEKLYSTGNDELDNLLERAFCEGYEYAQKEFAKKSKDAILGTKKNNKESKSKKDQEYWGKLVRKTTLK